MAHDLKKQIKAKFGTLRKFAEVLGINEATLNKKLNDVSAKFMLELKTHGIGENINTMESNASPVEINYFPILTTVYAGGSQMLMEESNKDGYFFYSYPKSDRCFAVKVEGDSMFEKDNNRSMKEGDRLFIRMDDTASPGDIVIVRTKQGRQYIKQLLQKNGEYLLHSFNSQYPDLLIHEDEIECIYKVHAIHPKAIGV